MKEIFLANKLLLDYLFKHPFCHLCFTTKEFSLNFLSIHLYYRHDYKSRVSVSDICTSLPNSCSTWAHHESAFMAHSIKKNTFYFPNFMHTLYKILNILVFYSFFLTDINKIRIVKNFFFLK